ncbi:MAG: methionyl-tRNA formyltransferase [Candidatus Spechtbacterales bacterium]|nr:methionyl-tRNA formyltransferase [Candidatus Spechtbacterales bacterium]
MNNNKVKSEYNIIFFGTSTFAKIILGTLIDSKYKPALVVTAPDRPTGRKQELTPPPVKILAEKNKIPVFQPESLKAAKNKLGKTEPDLFIVAEYGKILPKEVIELPKHGAINIHASLLPKYRGSSPIQFALLHGDQVTGNTIILMDEEMDHGPMLSQEMVEVEENDTTETLRKKLAYHGARLLMKTLPDWISGEITPFEQDHSKATYTKIITRNDGKIDWTKSADDIKKMWQAYTPWPGLFTFWKNKRLKILTFEVVEHDVNNPGEVIRYKDVFAIQTQNNIIVPQKIQLEGKKPQGAKEFLNGHEEIIGMRLI